jgi:replicative DNA helicase
MINYFAIPGQDRQPPQAIDVEATVIGTCLLYPDTIHELGLVPEMFYKDSHRKIFDAILTVSRKGGVDLVTVTEFLRNKGILDQVGGVMALTQLTNGVVSDQMADFHAMILKEKHIKREYIRIA